MGASKSASGHGPGQATSSSKSRWCGLT